jgi:predicted NBD/HSP70 family sugar kinase
VEVVAGKAGIEDIWRRRNRRHLPGPEISARYQSGNRLARDLYDASARLTAHVILGMAEAFGLVADSPGPVVVGHGAVFDVPGYGERVIDILDCDASPSPRFLFASEFSRNTCLEGAAVAAATSYRQRA